MHAQWVAIYLSVFFSSISAAEIRFTCLFSSSQSLCFMVWIVFHPVVGKTVFLDRSFFGVFDFC